MILSFLLVITFEDPNFSFDDTSQRAMELLLKSAYRNISSMELSIIIEEEEINVTVSLT